MNISALNKVKQTLLEQTSLYKEREKLKKKYINKIGDITFRHLGEKGVRIIEKYSENINYIDYIHIPGNIKTFNNLYGSRERVNVYSRKIPFIFDTYFYYWGNFDSNEVKSILSEKELDQMKKIYKKLEELSDNINIIITEIAEAFHNITIADLKNNFPEAYLLYNKFRCDE